MGNSQYLFFPVVFGFIVLMSCITRAARIRRTRLELVARALERPDLDEATKRMLVETLRGSWWSRSSGSPDRHSVRSPRHLLLIAGWLGIFVGIGMASVGRGDDAEAGIVILLISIGVLTLPFALRELERQRPA